MHTEKINGSEELTLANSGNPQRTLSQRTAGDSAVSAPRVRQLGTFQSAADNSARAARITQLRAMANAGAGPVQLMSDGVKFNRRLMGAKAEEKTALKVWGDGEFYAWDRTNERKDHHHAHVWKAEGDPFNALVEGHVVTAKGVGADKDKRNLTKITITGAKDDDDSWTVESRTTDTKLELKDGSPQVPLDKHEEEEMLVRFNLQNAVHYLLNTPDEELGFVSDGAEKIATRIAKRRRQKQAAKAARAKTVVEPDDEGDVGFSLFD